MVGGYFLDGNGPRADDPKQRSAVKAVEQLSAYALPTDCPFYPEGSEANVDDGFQRSLVKINQRIYNWSFQ